MLLYASISAIVVITDFTEVLYMEGINTKINTLWPQQNGKILQSTFSNAVSWKKK